MKQYEFMRDTDENGNESVSVSYKPKRKLDLFPRIICLFVALIIWLWMVNFNDTDVTLAMVVKIEYVGAETLDQKEMMIYGMDKNEITITVKGSNRDIRKHDPEEYSAVVDVSKIGEEPGQYTLPLTVKVPTDSNVTVESELLNISLMADKRATKRISFDVLASNSQDSGLIRYSYIYTQSQKEIEISGPKTIIDSINTGRFKVDGSFVLTEDGMDFSEFPLTFLDKNLGEVTNAISAVEYSTKDINVNVEAIAHKSISLKIDVKENADGLVPKPGTDSIEIWGLPSVVRRISDYTIQVDKAELGKTATYKLTSDQLPDGANVKEDIIVSISFEEPISNENAQ